MSRPDAPPVELRSASVRGGWRDGHCVLAPDKFKGSLTAPEVAAHLATGLRRVRPDLPLVTMPVADGGDGTVDAVVESGFVRFQTSVTGPLGLPVAASFAMRGEAAVIELAEASGLRRLPLRPTFHTAMTATSYGTGELIRAAARRGARQVVLGLGGSACTDGGVGMMSALGVRFLDEHDRELPPGAAALSRLARIDAADMLQVPVIVASDVDNPLLGPRGAAQVYGPQKGARPREVDELEWGLARLASIVERDVGAAVAQRPGAGAAGGVGYAALAFLGATVRPGIELILELMSFTEKVQGARLVITGEGSLDPQTLHGKAPVGVARAAASASVPVVAVAGQRALTDEQLRGAHIEAAYALTDLEPDPEVCIAQAGPLLEQLAGELAGAWLGANAHA
ncbi:glycerate kinase [Nocardia brasiliensis]|uniref:Glycerate kinase n=1 Tax=Nocardia brasiliensis (strain ATCC 700358 / HUJEG-1) TaxID=1133849 RepID=K0ENL6_NOCB7|nr:glycerate kinase [Nocardia brasiliensis]AFU01208.1 glycerate kinase [Nocardia brasiliensis ATCC 700358]